MNAKNRIVLKEKEKKKCPKPLSEFYLELCLGAIDGLRPGLHPQ